MCCSRSLVVGMGCVSLVLCPVVLDPFERCALRGCLLGDLLVPVVVGDAVPSAVGGGVVSGRPASLGALSPLGPVFWEWCLWWVCGGLGLRGLCSGGRSCAFRASLGALPGTKAPC